MQPFRNVKDERLYRFHKLYAESYVTNLRNLEAPWKPVVASVLDAIVQRVYEKYPLIDLSVQQEQPLPPPSLAAASVDADGTMTASRHKGTVYPDISILRYLLGTNDDFQTFTPGKMEHKAVDYLVCAELKRSIRRAYIKKGITIWDRGYTDLVDLLRNAATQATRQAFVAMKRPGQTNSDIILFAASGPFWMWCSASRSQVLGCFERDMAVEDVLDEFQIDRDEDVASEQLNDEKLSDGKVDYDFSTSTALYSPMSREDVFFGYDVVLPWTQVVMFDTVESEAQLRALLVALDNSCKTQLIY